MIQMEHSGVHASVELPTKEMREVLVFTSCVELILMVLSKHYHSVFFPPFLKLSCQINYMCLCTSNWLLPEGRGIDSLSPSLPP
jgi:hypothetical protein